VRRERAIGAARPRRILWRPNIDHEFGCDQEAGCRLKGTAVQTKPLSGLKQFARKICRISVSGETLTRKSTLIFYVDKKPNRINNF